MKKKRLIMLIAFILTTFSSVLVFAETIYFKSGGKIEGKIIEKTDKYIKLDWHGSGRILTYYPDEIEKIDEKGPVAPAKEEITFYKDAKTNYAMALGRVLNGLHKEAILYLEKAIEIDPNYAEAYALLGTAYNSLGKYKEAKKNLLKAKELYQQKGDSKALKAIEEDLNKLPESKDVSQ